MFGELAHELLMNAMYDAPVNAAGEPRFAQDRKADVALAPGEQAILRVATDGNQVALQVRDPFGRLERRHVFDGLARGLSGEMDRSHGGAGLGMMVCHNTSTAMFFDVVRDRHTEVTALFELDINLREFRTQAKSLHFWRH
jgi:K+-sensing histidine kinase KdpD